MMAIPDREKFRKQIKNRCYSDGLAKGLDSFMLIPKAGRPKISCRPQWNKICLAGMWNSYEVEDFTAMVSFPLARLSDGVINREQALRYIDWLQSYSPLSRLFVYKTSPEDVLEHGVTISLRKGLIPAAMASTLLRFIAEFPNVFPNVDKLLNMTRIPFPYNMNLAVLLANVSSTGLHVPVQNGHRFVNTNEVDERIIRNWVMGKQIKNRGMDRRRWAKTFGEVPSVPMNWHKFKTGFEEHSMNPKVSKLYKRFALTPPPVRNDDSIRLTEEVVHNLEDKLFKDLLP